MKNNPFQGIDVVSVLILAFSLAFSQERVDINGYVKSDNRLRVEKNIFTWNENRLNLRFEGEYQGKYHYFSEVRLRGFGFPNVSQSIDLQLQDKSRVHSWGLEFREAYMDLYGFGLENLDIRIGRQIIQWGTADALNPTGNLSPDDLEDIFNFGEKLGINAINATYYWGDNLTINGVYIPIFTPAILPVGDFATAFSPPMEFPVGLTIGAVSDAVVLPEHSISESSQYGLKLNSILIGYDVSFSYFKGLDDLPIASKVTITPIDMTGMFEIATELVYPEMQVFGGDFAGSLGSVGIWGEGALFKPEKVGMITISPSFISPGQIDTLHTLSLEDEFYFKFVLGSDYTFKNGLYFNGQFLHGFLHERGKDALNDYFTFRLEKKFLNDQWKIVPIGGAVAINEWNDIKNNYGLVYAPEISYYPSDNVELSIGSFIINGKGDNMFWAIKDLDEVLFRLKVYF